MGGIDISEKSRAVAFCLRGASQRDIDLYVMINANSDDIEFQLQEDTLGGWKRAIDTARASPDDIVAPSDEMEAVPDRYRVHGRSVAVLIQASEPQQKLGS